MKIGDHMNRKGFVTSALLYGILSLFLVLILGTIAIAGNRKITNDKLKQSALDDVQNLTTDISCFSGEISNGNLITIMEYDPNNNEEICTKTVFVPKTVTSIGPEAFKDKNIINITFKTVPMIDETAFNGNDNVLFIFKGTSPQIAKDSNTLWGAINSSIRID